MIKFTDVFEVRTNELWSFLQSFVPCCHDFPDFTKEEPIKTRGAARAFAEIKEFGWPRCAGNPLGDVVIFS